MSDLGTARIEYFFPHPFLRHIWANSAELNKELRDRILAHERTNPGRARTNVGGWHSEVGLLEWCGEAGKTLIGQMVELANHASGQVFAAYGKQPSPFSWTLQAWANVNRTGAFNRTHTHPGSTWSGTYYVDAGGAVDGDTATPLNLIDPCQGRAATFFPITVPENVFIFPEPGLMVLFPSYIPHMVYPHQGKRPRISIAFNLRKEPFP